MWKVLYNANKSKMPDPNNPDLIEPGMVIDIPSVKGETREGMWRP
jgi:nucleoid-associated protein YgaU